jgi:hypothetical protein
LAVASGFDVLCHALESFTALLFSSRGPCPASPALRPAYQGADPFSDVWATHALRPLARCFMRSVADRGDVEACEGMNFAATAAGVGFGSAGVRLCHGNVLRGERAEAGLAPPRGEAGAARHLHGAARARHLPAHRSSVPRALMFAWNKK